MSAKAFAAEHGAPAFAWPLVINNILRTQPGWKGVKLYPLKGKLGRMVIIRFKSGALRYFSSLTGCRAVRKVVTVTNLNALR